MPPGAALEEKAAASTSPSIQEAGQRWQLDWGPHVPWGGRAVQSSWRAAAGCWPAGLLGGASRCGSPAALLAPPEPASCWCSWRSCASLACACGGGRVGSLVARRVQLGGEAGAAAGPGVSPHLVALADQPPGHGALCGCEVLPVGNPLEAPVLLDCGRQKRARCEPPMAAARRSRARCGPGTHLWRVRGFRGRASGLRGSQLRRERAPVRLRCAAPWLLGPHRLPARPANRCQGFQAARAALDSAGGDAGCSGAVPSAALRPTSLERTSFGCGLQAIDDTSSRSDSKRAAPLHMRHPGERDGLQEWRVRRQGAGDRGGRDHAARRGPSGAWAALSGFRGLPCASGGGASASGTAQEEVTTPTQLAPCSLAALGAAAALAALAALGAGGGGAAAAALCAFSSGV
jgi:hypothetical protein